MTGTLVSLSGDTGANWAGWSLIISGLSHKHLANDARHQPSESDSAFSVFYRDMSQKKYMDIQDVIPRGGVIRSTPPPSQPLPHLSKCSCQSHYSKDYPLLLKPTPITSHSHGLETAREEGGMGNDIQSQKTLLCPTLLDCHLIVMNN